ncbi:MAG: hypothetical protein Ct9H300mP13_5570 [Gammaproteobacteria bacterium]|nr:MAG: hypothetical protein Ct9H300mP13_5570 [Gammaproteobacteria bacterium]
MGILVAAGQLSLEALQASNFLLNWDSAVSCGHRYDTVGGWGCDDHGTCHRVGSGDVVEASGVRTARCCRGFKF